MEYIDTHCHIHESDYALDKDTTLDHARQNGISGMICVGTNSVSSHDAVEFAQSNDHVFASIGVHPHDTQDGYDAIQSLIGHQKIVAVGEIGLDYYYNHSPRDVQIKALKWQIQLALDSDLPIIFHVRDAFDDFWPIFDSFTGINGVLHSFTDTAENMQAAIDRGLLIGVNGISTFTKDPVQQAMFASIPLSSLLLETDAPFLTPVPFRGKVNEPAFVKNIAEHHALIRGLNVTEIASATTTNARALFAL
jgi:TatD DNase family protein